MGEKVDVLLSVCENDVDGDRLAQLNDYLGERIRETG